MLRLFALFPNRCVQGIAHAVAVSSVLRRPARFLFRDKLCDLPSAIFDEHAAVLALGAAVPLRRAQWRNQYDRFQSALAARERAADSQRPCRRTMVQSPGT